MKDIICGSAGILLSLFVFIDSRLFNEGINGLAENPAVYPRILALLLAIFSLVVLIQGLRDRTPLAINREKAKNVTLFVALLVAYGLLFKPIGFLLDTLIGTAVFVWFFSHNWKKGFLVSFPVSVGVYIVFAYLLSVPLPKGLLWFV